MLLFKNKTPKKINFNGKTVREVIFNGISVWVAKIATLVTGKAPLELPLATGDDLVNYKVHGESVQQGIIPSEYQQVDYIETDGNQYLEIDYIASDKTNSEGIFQITNSKEGKMLFGARTSGSSSDCYSFNWGGGLPFKLYNNYGVTGLTTVEIDEDIHTFQKVANDLYYDGVKIHTNTVIKEFTTPYKMIVFGCNTGGTVSLTPKARIFNLKFSEAGEVKVDLIPCYRKADDVIGMYDLVTGTFYTNKGSGTFLKGKPIPSQDTPLEVQSVGELDAATGKYKIPVSINGTITNIYLNEPLRKVGDYADYIDYKNQKVIRKVGCYAFDGSEEWVLHTTTKDGGYGVFRNEGLLEPLIGAPISATFMTHFSFTPVTSTASWDAGQYRNQSSSEKINSSRIYISALQSTVADFTEWLSNNKPIYIYPLATTTEETIELPAIEIYEGTNTVDIDTTIQPSNVEIEYYKIGW